MFIGEIFLPGLKTSERYYGRQGRILIGGDLADVTATSAVNSTENGESGVLLTDAEINRDDFSEDEARDLAIGIVHACYDSIKEETFCPQRR